MPMTDAKRFDAPGRPSLAYDDIGDAGSPPVVLLHGGTVDRTTWRDFTPELATAYRVLALDQRGHGESGRAPGEYRIEHFTGDVAAFIEQVLGGPAAVAGHSLGAMVAAHLAATRPDLVERAFLVDPPIYLGVGDSEPPAFLAFFPVLKQLLDDLHARHGTVEELAALIGNLPNTFSGGTLADALGEERLHGAAAAWHRFDTEVLAGLDSTWDAYDPTVPMTCPVHLLRAEPGQAAFPPEHEERFLATHPKATVELVDGASHLIPVEQPERLLAALRAFLVSG